MPTRPHFLISAPEREENSMRRVTVSAALVLGLAALSVTGIAASAQQPTVQRKVLLTQDLPIPGYQVVMAAVEIPAGGREGRHTHPGALVAHVQEGTLTLDVEGKPTETYKAGDTLFMEAGRIHEGINKGGSPVKIIATFVVEKGKPLTSPAP
jgi:quercetin dioxygenase-like cupin family protein